MRDRREITVEIERTNAEIDRLIVRRSELLRERHSAMEAECPLKVGHVVKSTKDRREYKVTGVEFRLYPDETYVFETWVQGVSRLKSGEWGKKVCRLYGNWTTIPDQVSVPSQKEKK